MRRCCCRDSAFQRCLHLFYFSIIKTQAATQPDSLAMDGGGGGGTQEGQQGLQRGLTNTVPSALLAGERQRWSRLVPAGRKGLGGVGVSGRDPSRPTLAASTPRWREMAPPTLSSWVCSDVPQLRQRWPRHGPGLPIPSASFQRKGPNNTLLTPSTQRPPRDRPIGSSG